MISFNTSLICSILAVLILFSSTVTMPVNISAQTADEPVMWVEDSGLPLPQHPLLILKKILKIEDEFVYVEKYAPLLTPFPSVVLYLWDLGVFFFIFVSYVIYLILWLGFYLISSLFVFIFYYILGIDLIGLDDLPGSRANPTYIN